MQTSDALIELRAVTTTVGSADDAQRLARAALDGRLAACVQVEAVVSHYRWDGALQQAPEQRLLFKTLPAAVPGLLALLHAQHPYTLPELAVQALFVSADYADWVRGELAG